MLVAERTRELVTRNSQLEATLKTNEDLIREVHHRVRNNLQIIISLMDMRTTHAGTSTEDDFCQATQRRIASISLVHELLFSSDFLESLSVLELLEFLANNVCEMSSYGTSRVDLRADSIDRHISLGIAMPLGLIVSEIISNSLHYAHKSSNPGVTTIWTSVSGDSLTLRISDDGEGFPSEFSAHGSANLGLRLVEALTEQIKGTCKFYNEGGAVFEITFPV